MAKHRARRRSLLRKSVEFLRQVFCKHEWRMTMFQSLCGPTSYYCGKCGKQSDADEIAARGEIGRRA